MDNAGGLTGYDRKREKNDSNSVFLATVIWGQMKWRTSRGPSVWDCLVLSDSVNQVSQSVFNHS